MGKWSPYSEEWEKQHINKFIEKADAAHKEFEKRPKIYKAIVKFVTTIRYYWSILTVHVHMLFNRKYREEMKHLTGEFKDNALSEIAKMIKDDNQNP